MPALPTTSPFVPTAEQKWRHRRWMAAALAMAALCATVGATAYLLAGGSDAGTADTPIPPSPEEGSRRILAGVDEPPLDLPPRTGSVEAELGLSGSASTPTADDVSLIAAQFGPDPYRERDHLQMILEGQLGLADIRYLPHSFAREPSAEQDDQKAHYVEVYGDFCVYDLNLNRQSPADYPTVRDIMGQSSHCGEHRYSLPLREVVDAIRAHDAQPTSAVRSIPVTGIILHEGRSGAALISNALAVARPESTRVISEHPAVLEALRACDMIRNHHRSDDCDPAKQQQLLNDVVLLLSRTAGAWPNKLYLKMQSSATPYLGQLRTSFPEAKWAFVYRDADAALAKATQRKRNSSCIKARRNPTAAMTALADAHRIDLEGISNHEICAMHLATFINAAFEEHDVSGTGILISYDEDIVSSGSDVILDVILPYLGIDEAKSSQEVRERVSSVLSFNANARGRQDGKRKWDPKDDRIDVTDEVKAASEKFLKHSVMAVRHGGLASVR